MKTIAVASIDDKNRLRPVNADWAATIAASIEQKGLDTPIVIRATGERYALVAGGHRLAAMKLLGWTELKVGDHVIIREMSELEARLAEIDENLIRHELTPLDRAIFLSQRKAVYEEMHPETAHGGDRKSKKSKDEIKSPTWRLDLPARFTAEASERVGLSERTIQRALMLIEKLSPKAIDALRGTALEHNQGALLALAEENSADQVALAKLIASGECANLQQARVKRGLVHESVRDEQARIWSQFLALWEKANTRTKANIREHIAPKTKG
jgi:ParB family transcriptional regulator, chromosome partitioning protein